MVYRNVFTGARFIVERYRSGAERDAAIERMDALASWVRV